MSPVASVAETVTEGLSRIDIDRQLPLNGHASLQHVREVPSDQSPLSTFASGSSGDLPGTSDHRSGLTEPAQLVNMSGDASQQQKPLPISRFIPSEESASANSLPANQYPTPSPTPSTIPSSSTYANYPPLRYPNHESRVANRHGPFVFREQTGVRGTAGRIPGGHNSYQGSSPKPSSGSLPHPATRNGNTSFPLGRPPLPPSSRTAPKFEGDPL
jgi:hypothetical protein